MKIGFLVVFACCLLSAADRRPAGDGWAVRYVRGTVDSLQPGIEGELEAFDDNVMRFRSAKGTVEIRYDRITWLTEYTEAASHRGRETSGYAKASLKNRRPVIAIGYDDDADRPQGLVLEVIKLPVRTVIADLEALSGVKCEHAL